MEGILFTYPVLKGKADDAVCLSSVDTRRVDIALVVVIRYTAENNTERFTFGQNVGGDGNTVQCHVRSRRCRIEGSMLPLGNIYLKRRPNILHENFVFFDGPPVEAGAVVSFGRTKANFRKTPAASTRTFREVYKKLNANKIPGMWIPISNEPHNFSLFRTVVPDRLHKSLLNVLATTNARDRRRRSEALGMSEVVISVDLEKIIFCGTKWEGCQSYLQSLKRGADAIKHISKGSIIRVHDLGHDPHDQA